MCLLEPIRRRIRASLNARVRVRVYDPRGEGLTVSLSQQEAKPRPRLHEHSGDDFAFFPRVRSFTGRTLSLLTTFTSIDTGPLHAHTRMVALLVHASTRSPPVIIASPRVHTADLVIALPLVHRFTFARGLDGHRGMRDRDRSLVTTQPGHARDPKPIAAGLHERLLWILSPPIHELLQDPALSLPARPYPYQCVGVKWLLEHPAALLADEMGLGKTMQAILAARLLFRERLITNVLVVCPKSLVPTWLDQIRKWWPQVLSSTKVIDTDPEWFLRLKLDSIILKIINYERVARILEWLRRGDVAVVHDLIILDEAQRIKNPGSATAQAVKLLRAPRRWALTGTPLENRPDDLRSIFDFLTPGMLPAEEMTLDELRDRTRPYILRRRAADVLDDLPPIDDQDVPLELTPAQRDTYDRAESSGVVALNDQGDTITVQHVFALIQRLIQICNFDPKTTESAKLSRLAEDLEEIFENEHKALVFSQYVSPPFGIRAIREYLPDKSRKLRPDALMELHGDVPSRDREHVLDRFVSGPPPRVLLLNYRVGGVGLNLQDASYVFLYDRWWNPAVEDQAIKRAHRIGQRKKVIVRRFFCVETVEERILRKLAEKRRLFAHVVDDAAPTPEMMGLSEEEVFQLFPGLKARPKRQKTETDPVQIHLDEATESEFLSLVAQVYERQEYDVEILDHHAAIGVDMIAVRSDGPRHERVGVRCWHRNEPIGPEAVKDLVGVLSSQTELTAIHFVTSGTFTSPAAAAALAHPIVLIDRARLLELARDLGVAIEAPPPP